MCFLLRLQEYIHDEPLMSLLLDTQLIHVPTFRENIQKDVWELVDHHIFMAHMLVLLNVGSDIIKIEIEHAIRALQNHILSCKLIQLRLQKGGCLGDLDVLPTDCMRYISDFLP